MQRYGHAHGVIVLCCFFLDTNPLALTGSQLWQCSGDPHVRLSHTQAEAQRSLSNGERDLARGVLSDLVIQNLAVHLVMNEIKRLGAEPQNIGVCVVVVCVLAMCMLTVGDQRLATDCAASRELGFSRVLHREMSGYNTYTQERINWEYKVCGALKHAVGAQWDGDSPLPVQEVDGGDVADDVSDAEVHEVCVKCSTGQKGDVHVLGMMCCL